VRLIGPTPGKSCTLDGPDATFAAHLGCARGSVALVSRPRGSLAALLATLGPRFSGSQIVIATGMIGCRVCRLLDFLAMDSETEHSGCTWGGVHTARLFPLGPLSRRGRIHPVVAEAGRHSVGSGAAAQYTPVL